MQTKQIIGIILLIIGAAGLLLGIFGIFGQSLVALSPWALSLIGVIFFIASVSLLKRTSR
ncbi:MAG: hypothetical protein ACNS62_14290 [Candidatus Cyclobacteriaceae bacterium M3_2C_046]